MQKLTIALLLLMLALTACTGTQAKMTPSDIQALQPILSSLRPMCIGRYLIDLPTEMRWGGKPETKIEAVSVQVEPMPRTRFEQQLGLRKTELAAQKVDGRSSLGNTTLLPNSQGLIIDFANTSTQADRRFELWAWRDGYQIRLSIKHRDATQATRKFSTDQPPNGVEQLKKLKAVFAKLRGRDNSEIPTETGFCFPNGFYAGSQTAELVDAAMSINGHDDITLAVTTDTSSVEESMLDRLSQRIRGEKIIAEDRRGEYKLLRSGTRNSNGLALEEVIGSGPTYELAAGKGGAYINGVTADAKFNATRAIKTEPWLLLTFESGSRLGDSRSENEINKVPRPNLSAASLSDPQTIALWDAIIATLRVRPAAK